MNNHSNDRKKLATNSLFLIYAYYKKVFFPKLLQDPSILNQDKDKIKALLAKPWNPYVRRRTGLTEKSKILKDSTLFKQNAGWSPNSNMAQKYVHYFDNESSGSLLETYGSIPKNSDSSPGVDLLSPKLCPNCNEGNTADAKFCARCRMVLTYDAYNETVEEKTEKDKEVQVLKEQVSSMQSAQKEILELLKDPDKLLAG